MYDFETYFNIMFNRKKVARNLFKEYQQELTIKKKITSNDLIELFESGISFE